MVELTLPANSRIDKSAGKTFKAPAGARNVRRFVVYRFDPDSGANPRMDTYEVDMDAQPAEQGCKDAAGPLPR